MLKSIFIFFSVLFVFSAHAENYGKFKLVPNSSIIDSDPVVFLLNSKGDVKILENDSYYTVSTNFFFGELQLEFVSGGDEDALRAIYSLSDNTVTSGCAAYVDYKNSSAESLKIEGFELLRWNKSKKKYESMITPETSSDTPSCYKTLLRDQNEDMEFFE